MDARVAASVLVSALMRRAEAQGGFAAVMARGDPTAGSILVSLVERGGKPRFYERIIQSSGRYGWQEIAQKAAGNDEETQKFLARRRNFDPDMWILELDVPSTERFAAEMNEFD